jgi:UDP-N-acetyl-D-mannosaminuronic acid dehydrogenase
MQEDNRICILGMGYVGLTLAAALCDRDFEVQGIEINPVVLASLAEGKAHFFEVGLDRVIQRGLRNSRLQFSPTIPVNREFDVYIITVGTPLGENGPRMDMVESVTCDIANHMRDGAMVLLRSTVKLGTSLDVVKPILDASGKRYELAMCPERTIEGKALTELFMLPQIVGGHTKEATVRASNIFRRLTPTIIAVSDLRTAEIIKLLDNSYRDLFFAFGNEVALMCESAGISAREVISAANMGYERTNIAKPGFVGGPCLEKDPHILIHSLAPGGFVPNLIRTGRLLNESLVDHVLDFVRARLPRDRKPVISLLGLAFKGRPDTDDLRGSTALLMIERIREQLPDATLRGQDYVVKSEQIAKLGIEPVSDTEAFQGADAALIMNNNHRYSTLDIETVARTMNRPGLVFDAWAVFSPKVDLPEGVKLHVLGQ